MVMKCFFTKFADPQPETFQLKELWHVWSFSKSHYTANTTEFVRFFRVLAKSGNFVTKTLVKTCDTTKKVASEVGEIGPWR